MGTTPKHSAAPAVYLDHNATTPVEPEVFATMRPWLEGHFGNPSSAHAFGRDAAEAVARARRQVADLIGADADEIVFTSGGTESNNWALFGALEPGASLVIGGIEHPAIVEPAQVLASRGHALQRLPVTPHGGVDLTAVSSACASGPGLVSVMLAHNETGVVQPIAELVAVVRKTSRATLVHTDAAQAVGKVAVDVRALGVDMLTIAGHKFGAPKGVGALYVKAGTPLRPMLFGGGQQAGRRPGTEAVAPIVALGAAAELARHELDSRAARQIALRDRLWRHLVAAIDGMWWFASGGDALLLPNTLFCCFPRCDGARLLAAAPQVAASTGSACHAHDGPAAGVLAMMGVAAERRRGTVRLSLGRATSEADIDTAAQTLVRAWQTCRDNG